MTTHRGSLLDRASRPESGRDAVGGGVRWATAVTVGLVTAFAVGVGLLGLSSPWLSSGLALVLVLVAPTASRLDRRIAINLSLLVGWAPLAVLVPPGLGPRTAAVGTLSVVAGVVAAVWVVRRSPLMPVARARDAAIVLAALLAASVALPLRSPGSPARALAMLSTGIDHGFQFSMYVDRRLTAGIPAFAVGADNSGFSNYPKWFHSLLTMLAQVVFGEVGRPDTELVRYAQLEWIVFVVIAALITAALLQALPRDTSMAFLVPGLVLTWSLVLGVPGSLNLIQGHLGFLLAACAPAVIFLLSVSGDRVTPLVLATIAGLVVLAASWTLLLPFALVAAGYPTFMVWRRQRWAVRWAVVALTLAIGAAVSLFLVPLAASAAIQDLVRDGTIPRVRLPVMVPLLVAPIVLVLFLLRRRPRSLNLIPHLLLLLAGAGQLAVLAAYMFSVTGQLTYYFYKLGLGLTHRLHCRDGPRSHAGVRQTSPPEDARTATRRRWAALAICLLALVGLGSALREFAAPSARVGRKPPVVVGWARLLRGCR